MDDEQTHEATDKKGPRADWEAIEREYRAGIFSIREIGRRFGVSEKSVRNHAKEGSWQRDLQVRIRQATSAVVARREADARFVNMGEVAKADDIVVSEAADICADKIQGHLARAQKIFEIADATIAAIQAVQRGETPSFNPFITKSDGFSAVTRSVVAMIDSAITWERIALNMDENRPEQEPKVYVFGE